MDRGEMKNQSVAGLGTVSERVFDTGLNRSPAPAQNSFELSQKSYPGFEFQPPKVSRGASGRLCIYGHVHIDQPQLSIAIGRHGE